MEDKFVSIKIYESTKHILDRIKHEGQSYDGCIRELVRTREKFNEHERRIRELEKRVK